MKNNYEDKACEYLKQNIIFCNCLDENIAKLVKGAKLKSFSKGQIIFSPQNQERCIGIIAKGQASVSKGAQNHLIISKLQAGELFGAVTLFSGKRNFVNTITASTACCVVFFDYDSILELMKREPSVWQNYISYLSDRIYFLNDRIDEFTACNASGKLAMYLEECFKGEDEGKLSVSMTALSKVLGIGRSSLYRALDELEQSDAIKRSGKQIIILNRDILNEYAK